MKTTNLYKDLFAKMDYNIEQVEAFLKLPLDKLNYKNEATSWSILECIAHLNKYGDFYIPEINKCIKDSAYKAQDVFRSGVLGGYFVKSVSYKKKLNMMKTFASMDPINSELGIDVLECFLEQQYQLKELLIRSQKVDLTKTKTAISISKWIKLRLGDTLGVVIYHNERHVEQALRVL